ncbi:PEP/pyruvate-binding domain-containing protein, partial [Thermodesulfobacteriota bacterium]
LSADLQQLIIRSPVPEDLERAILEHYGQQKEKHGQGVRVAMRSSALGEDFTGISFAGQYRTMLNVSRENILQAYKEVLASKYSLQAMNYRLTRGIRDDEVPMCVGCMPMVEALSGGVVYSRNPVNIRDDTVAIHSVWGLPKSVVDGITFPDVFIISRTEPMTILKKEIAAKVQKTICHPLEGISRQELTSKEKQRPSLSDEQALELARMAVLIENHFGVPQDIEWAVGKDHGITILQCRPLQQVERPASSEGEASDIADTPCITKGGSTASPGIGIGPVFIVKKDADVLQFPKGAVLVTAQALPRWATMLDRAAAVVTEQGGVAGHLASVAREYGIPALFGVKDAFSKLRTDQSVTVDADGRLIYEGRVKSLLTTQGRPANLMEGSPVFKVLKRTASHITPLTLLDPDAPTFRSNNCKTLHDITRFCHEQSVKEMFLFGKEHTFPERSGKRLVSDTPMQWLILNLDDGFKEEVSGGQVRLGNIASIPMLALWEGISAFPWAGPPPIDGRGFLSVMFEATQNTSLVPGMRSRYTGRNYFMISKNYCNLNSRLGFHFSIVEALVSGRSGENYISFQFKGGATDNLRRRKRLFFISEMLGDYHFQVKTEGDHLMARLEERDMEYMINCLRVLGYLTIHTRQLDMIMSNNKAVSYYRTKFREDIQHMLDSFGSDRNGDRPTVS